MKVTDKDAADVLFLFTQEHLRATYFDETSAMRYALQKWVNEISIQHWKELSFATMQPNAPELDDILKIK